MISRSTLSSIFLGVCSLFTGIVLATFLISMLYVLSHMEGSAQFPETDESNQGRCALVFGSAIKKGGESGPAIVRRVAAAVKLYEEGRVGTLIMSGGRGKGMSMSEASVMEKEARDGGVPKRDILLEERSTSTLENIKFSQAILKRRCTSVLAVSDRYHLARIELLASRLDVPLQTFPAIASKNPLLELRSIAREGAAILYYLPYLIWRF